MGNARGWGQCTAISSCCPLHLTLFLHCFWLLNYFLCSSVEHSWAAECFRVTLPWQGSLHGPQSPWGHHYPSPSTGCILCRSVSALLWVHPRARSLRAICDPAWVAHGPLCLSCQSVIRSKSAFPACLHQCPLAHSSSISFLQTGLFTLLLTYPFLCPPVSSLTSPSASPFMWSHVHPAPVSITFS